MQETLASATMANQRPRGWNPFRILRSGQAYRAVFYFILGIPMAFLYLYLAGGISAYVDGGLLGVLLVIALALTLGWGMVWVERGLASWLLGARFTPVAPPLPADTSLWERFKAHLRNPVTWKSLVYLGARVPTGGLGLLALGLFGVSLALVIAPLLALAVPLSSAVGFYNSLVEHGIDPDTANAITDVVSSASSIPALLAPIPGVALWLLGLWFFENIGRGWSWFARQTLGVSPTALQLAEAKVMLVEARGRAARAEDDRRRLILDASHELRTPVATVRAYLDSLLLLENERLDDTLRQYLGVMQREIERLGLLVDDLLMLARADADKLRLEVRPISVGAVVEEVYQTMAPLAERERQVTLVRQFAEGGIPLAYADGARLAQALMNLVRNAITHTPAGGLVSIDLAPGATPETVTISVTDTGEGVSDEDLPHVFERFYRADAARARDTGGFGLGLSIVRDLVEGMGGTVSAGRAPEGGARFQIILRAAAGAPVSVA
jgi:two-component system, OmpR family, phosphate regulon sensor histidine kinase PhoR